MQRPRAGVLALSCPPASPHHLPRSGVCPSAPTLSSRFLIPQIWGAQLSPSPFSALFSLSSVPPPTANPVSLVPSSCPIWSVSPFLKIGSLLVFAQVLLVAPASSLSPTVSSLGACGGGEVLCPSLLRAASPCPSLMLCTLVCLQSLPYTRACQFLPSNLLLLRPHWGVGEGRGGDSQGLREHVKVFLWWGAGGQHLGRASRPQIRQ